MVSSHRILEDAGRALDWFRDGSLKNNAKLIKFCYGPTLYQLGVVHPDGAKVILKGGGFHKLIILLINKNPSPPISDPKSEQIYSPLEPWLGKVLYMF